MVALVQENNVARSIQDGVRREAFIRWLAPPAPWFTLNIDGPSKGPSQLTGGGGVIRHCRVMFIRGFSATFGSCSPYKVEVTAAAIGLEMAKELSIAKL